MNIGVNCGHTKSGAGCGAVGFINESDETRKVGYKLMEYLEQAGHTVYNCTNDRAASANANLSAIVSLANCVPLDLFISIHFNAGRGQGVECYTYGGKEHAEAVNICRNIYRLGFRNRGVKDGSHLYVVNKTNAKAILVEVCFVDTKSDTDLYEMRGADTIAKAICEAITGQSVKEPTETKETATPKSETTEEETVNITLLTLQKGSEGKQVKTLQRLLIALGYSCGNAGVDGDFGTATDKAVKAFQKDNGLTVDGIVGVKSWTKLLK